MRATNEKHQKRILIIDDDIDLLMLLERGLAKEGYWVEAAASLPEGEEVIASFKPHLILLDINVNGEDGRQLCWKLKKQMGDQAVKVIIISGYDYSAGRAVLFGADDLLPKPFQFDYLSTCIKTQLGEGTTIAPLIFPSFNEPQ
jgi:DNA-binding response OmpR family regulator